MVYFCESMYLQKTADALIANDGNLLGIGAAFLRECTNEQDEDNYAFDNVCTFLWFAGRIAGQQVQFWNTLLEFCMKMEADYEEIGRTLMFFIREGQIECQQQITKLVVTLFFGKYYAIFLLEENDTYKGLPALVRAFL